MGLATVIHFLHIAESKASSIAASESAARSLASTLRWPCPISGMAIS